MRLNHAFTLNSVRLYGKGVVLDAPADGASLKMKRHQLAKTGQVILSEIWGKKGAIGFVPPEGEGALCTSHFFLFDVHTDWLYPGWLKAIFEANYLQPQLEADAKGTTGYAAVRPKTLLACEIPLPPFAEQRRIVARIEELAAKIHEARTLRQQATEEAGDILNRVAEAEFDNQTSHASLSELCSIITDGTHQTPRYTEDGHIFLSAQNVKPFRFMPEQHRKVSFADYRSCVARVRPQVGDVLLTRVGAGIGEAAMIDRDLDFAFYVSLALLRPMPEKIQSEFLVHWLNAPNGRAQSRRQTLGKGHSQGNLNLKLLRSFQVPVPPVSEQRRIVAELNALHTEVDVLKRLQAETTTELDALLPAILGRAFKGEL